MAITKFGIKHESGPTTDQDGHKHYTRVYGVTTDGLDSLTAIANDPRVPDYFDPHPDNALAKVVHVDPRRVPKSKRHAEITVEFSTNVGRRQEPNPLARRAVITGSFNDVRRPVWKDRDGRLPQTTGANRS